MNHIDEFEKEFPPGDAIRFYPEVNEYRMKPASMAANPCEADIEAGKQNARLEVWLKQREKMEKLKRAFAKFISIAETCDGWEEFPSRHLEEAEKSLEAADD